MAWALTKAGDEPARIAHKLKLDVEEVEQAVRDFEAARVLASSDMIDMLVNTEVITAMDGVGDDIQEARRAVRFTGAYNGDGDPIYERDFGLALDAIKTAGELVAQVRPKGGGGVAVNVGINNNGNGGSVGPVKTFEQRVREKRGVLPEGDVKFLSDGKGEEIIDGDVDDDDLDDDDDDIVDDMADGTSDLEIEEADEVRD